MLFQLEEILSLSYNCEPRENKHEVKKKLTRVYAENDQQELWKKNNFRPKGEKGKKL